MVYNAMLHPLLSYSLYGAIWYQGETDALQLSGRLTGRYNCTFVNMITDLRRTLYENTMGSTNINFPFGFVQVRGRVFQAVRSVSGVGYYFGMIDVKKKHCN